MNGEYSIAASAREKVSDAMRRGVVYVLGVEELVNVLRSYISGEISASDVEEWAEVYDVNEGVEFEREGDVDIIFELSAPEINGLLTVVRAEQMLSCLVKSGG